MSTRDELDRRWVYEIAELRHRAVRATRDVGPADPGGLAEILHDTLLPAHLFGQNVAFPASYDHLFATMPAACLCTDRKGSILCANDSAAALLNISAKRLNGRLLLHFAHDRTRCAELLTMPVSNGPWRRPLTIRPRERFPLPAECSRVNIKNLRLAASSSECRRVSLFHSRSTAPAPR